MAFFPSYLASTKPALRGLALELRSLGLSAVFSVVLISCLRVPCFNSGLKMSSLKKPRNIVAAPTI